MSGNQPVPDSSLVVVGEECPMNWVLAKLELERLGDGQVLEVFVSPGIAEKNVPRSARDEGHEVLSVTHHGDRVRVLVRKKEARDGS
ncbi:MAG: sulfurtransferase TusA family protein [Planctomycetota bacterium]